MIKIIADSTCDLSDDILERYNISLVHLNIIINNKSYKERLEMTADEFYKLIPTLDEQPTTSMPSPIEFINAFENAIDEGYKQILCICMSSQTSGTYQSAVIGLREFNDKYPDSDAEIYIVDSTCMSLGSGWLIMKTAQLLEKGFTFEELIEFNEEYKTNVKHYLCVDDLNNLIKSGRLTNTSAFLGKLLRIKPIMTMKNKKGAIVAQERGWRRVLRHYVTEFKERIDEEYTNFIIIGYTDIIKHAENLKEAILSDTNFLGDIYIMQKGITVGNHVGSGGLSLFFMEKSHFHDGFIRNKLRERKKQLEDLLSLD